MNPLLLTNRRKLTVVACNDNGSRVDNRRIPSRGDAGGGLGKWRVDDRRRFEMPKVCLVGEDG